MARTDSEGSAIKLQAGRESFALPGRGGAVQHKTAGDVGRARQRLSTAAVQAGCAAVRELSDEVSCRIANQNRQAAICERQSARRCLEDERAAKDRT